MSTLHDDRPFSIGERIQLHRERSGKSREVLGGLVGRSAEWVKAVERGRLLPPRPPMLETIAAVLRVPLSDLVDVDWQQVPDLRMDADGRDLRVARSCRRISLRQMAAHVGRTTNHLSYVERNVRPVTPWLVSAYQKVLVSTLVLVDPKVTARSLHRQGPRA